MCNTRDTSRWRLRPVLARCRWTCFLFKAIFSFTQFLPCVKAQILCSGIMSMSSACLCCPSCTSTSFKTYVLLFLSLTNPPTLFICAAAIDGNPCLTIGKLSGPLSDTTLGSVSPRSSSAFCGCSLLSLNSFCSSCLQELLQPLLSFHLRQFADDVHPSSACHPLRNLSVAFLSVSLPSWADLQFCVLLLFRAWPQLLQVLPQ